MFAPPRDKRTDSIDEKIRLLQAARKGGRHDVAMSLAESIKDSLAHDHQTRDVERKADLPPGSSRPIGELPGPWRTWARGWAHFKAFSLSEVVGIAREDEPFEFTTACRSDQASDLGREIRVARITSADGVLHEVICQVHDERVRGAERSCRVVIPAEVEAHRSTVYLLFHGNPAAGRPRYVSDLNVEGSGYALDISNAHYHARLSRQMGQLERLTYRREHGLELYAGGKGHGEPPTIDWGHDYVDEEGFQKLRIRNWARCPNHEVVRGPLVTRVRIWGFPHSPVHPVYTPSRLHVDVTYTFLAGEPYFVKESRMEAVRDLRISALRDDEWVFSGYSFTDLLWIDSSGKLHEGPVPQNQAEKLWGVGFRHRQSRDAFVALRLEHRAENYDDLRHGGVPTLNYDGHGQLWSRYPAGNSSLKAGAALLQRNAYLLLEYPEENAAREIEMTRHRLLNTLELMSQDAAPTPGNATASGSLARAGETAESVPLKNAIWDALKQVRDEQLYKIDANIVDLGLVYDVRVRTDVAEITVTMPHRGRPVHDFLVSRGGGRVEDGIRERISKIDGIRDVVVHRTWEPPWTVQRLSPRGREMLGM